MKIKSKNSIQVLKILVLFLVPLIISILLFFNIEITFVAEDFGDEYKVEMSFEDFDRPSPLNSIRKIFKAPFNFNQYEIFLEDDCSKVPEKLSREVTFVYNISGTNYVLPQCGRVSIDYIRVDESFTYPKQIEAKMSIPPGESRMLRRPNTKIFAKPYIGESIAVSILVFLAWFAFWLLVVNMVRYVKEESFF